MGLSWLVDGVWWWGGVWWWWGDVMVDGGEGDGRSEDNRDMKNLDDGSLIA